MLENTRREQCCAHPLGWADELICCSFCHSLCYCRSFKTKQNLSASLVNEVDQNRSWTKAEQFRSSLCQFILHFGGDIHMLVALANVQLGQTKTQCLAPFLLKSSLPPKPMLLDVVGLGTGPVCPGKRQLRQRRPYSYQDLALDLG